MERIEERKGGRGKGGGKGREGKVGRERLWEWKSRGNSRGGEDGEGGIKQFWKFLNKVLVLDHL